MDLPEVTRREQDVLDLLALGKTNEEIGAALGVRPGTAKAHVSNLLEKTGYKNRTQLATWWQENKARYVPKD